MNATAACVGGSNNIPADKGAEGALASLAVAANGIITATGNQEVDATDYTLTPGYTPATNTLVWTVGGSCLAAGLCRD